MYCPERLSDGDCVFRIPASGVPDVAPCAGLVASSSAKQRDALEQNSDKLFVVAQGVRTGRNFLVRGRIVRWLPTQETSAKRAKRRSLTSTEYAIELQRVRAARDQGIDAMVTLPFILAHALNSGATVYRHIKAGALPAPSKVGRASVWPFSAVDAYARGTSPTQQAPMNNVDAAVTLPANHC